MCTTRGSKVVWNPAIFCKRTKVPFCSALFISKSAFSLHLKNMVPKILWGFAHIKLGRSGERVVSNLQRSRGHGQKFSFLPPPTILALAMPLNEDHWPSE